MKNLIATVLALAGVGVNLALTVHLMNIVTIVSAVQTVWAKAEGAPETISWLPVFVIIPGVAIAGAVFVAERLFKLARVGDLKDMVRFVLRVGAVQLAAWWLGRTMLVVARPVERTAGNVTTLGLLAVLMVFMWVFQNTPWGVRLFGNHQPKRAS